MFSEIVVCSLLYIAIVMIAYCPKNTTTTTPETVTHINYFPEPTEPETLNPSSESLESSEVAIAAISNPLELLPILADKPAAVTDSPDLQSLSIRQLKKMAQGRVKGYSSLTKSQLIQALAV